MINSSLLYSYRVNRSLFVSKISANVELRSVPNKGIIEHVNCPPGGTRCYASTDSVVSMESNDESPEENTHNSLLTLEVLLTTLVIFREVISTRFLCKPEVQVNLAGFLSRPEVRFGLVGSHVNFPSQRKSMRTCSLCTTVNKGRVPTSQYNNQPNASMSPTGHSFKVLCTLIKS